MANKDGMRVLVVIPALNEELYIGGLLEQLIADTKGLNAEIVVADGGSSDRTAAIVEDIAGAELLHNPKRIQSAAVNLAAEKYGARHDYLVRLDAHADYPHDYIQVLLAEAEETGAGSVVVAMDTAGKSSFGRAVAAAQNSRLGNGGSAHRSADGKGAWVEHGHHALMKMDVFKDAGWYDESFSHNEDAELDLRIGAAGHKIWLTGKTALRYYPREDVKGLWRQYYNFGKGRARTVMKHKIVPKLRQMLPLAVMPSLLMMVLGGVFMVPAIVWALVCLVYGGVLGFKEKDSAVAFAGVAAMVMHAAWSAGFWVQVIGALMDED